MPKPLSERIKAALSPSARLADIRSTLAECERERPHLVTQQRKVEQRAEDPATGPDDARAAREEAEDLAFEIRRLDRGVVQLKEAVQAKLDDESYAQRRQAYDEALAERDALIEQLRKDGAAALSTLARLAAAVHENDRRLAAVNRELPRDREKLISAEIIARNALNDDHWPTSTGQNGEPFDRLTTMKLPHFDQPGLAWPRRELSPTAHLDMGYAARPKVLA